MSWTARLLRSSLLLFAFTALQAAPVWAQGRGHGRANEKAQAKPKVTVDATVVAAKDVLVKQGFEVVRVEVTKDSQIIYYRAGNRGKGKGKGRLVRMIVRRSDDGVVLEEAPDAIRLEIGVKLGIKL
jgi:hypothetical protein